MTIAFPKTPTEGQQFIAQNGITYQYVGAKWSTRLVPSYANTGGNPGLTPPNNPSPGTFWWDSEAGQLYIWYVDADSAQWMQAAVLGTIYDSLGNVVTNNTLQSRNLATGTYDLSLALEGSAIYDGNDILDLPIALELGQNLEVGPTDTTITDSDTD